MDTKKQHDVIIVGLGCFGLGAAYYLSKQGLKVLGFDKAPFSGSFVSGSVGDTRVWRYMDADERYYRMMLESEEIFREVEEKIGEPILIRAGSLWMKRRSDPDLDELQKYGVRMQPEEIRKKWPALAVPDYMEGVFCKDAGVLKARLALKSFKEQSIQNGATLLFNQEVVKVDHEKGIVTLNSGEQYYGKHVVITCGHATDQFVEKENQFNDVRGQVHCYFLQDNVGLPAAFHMEDLEEAKGKMVWGCLDGENLQNYKLGHWDYELGGGGPYDPHIMLKIMQTVLPNKIDMVTRAQPCYVSESKDGELIFEKHGKTIYGFACNGVGFKHMGYHGKRIHNLIIGNQKEADKYKKPSA